jgi:predicted ribosome quality control (RQC) complex YloA/Tae2 family protein
MDSFLLEGVIRRLAPALNGHGVLRADRLDDLVYLLRFASPRADNLVLTLRPPHPALYRSAPGTRFRPRDPDPFLSLLARELEGALLTSLARRGSDRVVELRFERPGGETRELAAELLGKSGNLVLLDASRRVLGFARKLASAFRAPVVGEEYRAPIPRPGYEDVTWDPLRAGEYLSRFSRGGDPALAAAAFLAGLSRPLAEDFPRRREAAASAEEELGKILAAVAAGAIDPVLYTPAPLAEYGPDPGAAAAPPVISPFPLTAPPLPAAAPIPDPEEAARVFDTLERGWQEAVALRERIGSAVRREAAKLRRLEARLEGELAEAGKAETHQRYGDLILAQSATARLEGDAILLTDLYDPAGACIRIPADPSLSIRQNAERHYARARKLRRGEETIRGRLEATRVAIARVGAWGEELGRVGTTQGLRSLESSLTQAGLIARPTGGPPGRPSEPETGDPGIRRFRTAEGFTILVGKTSRDNDRLTFHVAAPHDFWFHAAARSGAHVVVRNPARRKELPQPVLLAAARIAAHFSRARTHGKVEVHYTLRKHVRKGRGFGPGLVTLRNYRTVEVEPGIPGSTGD